MRQAIDQRTGERTLFLEDAAEWGRELRLTSRRDGSIHVDVLILRDGIFETSESYFVRASDVARFGAWILSGSRLRAREVA